MRRSIALIVLGTAAILTTGNVHAGTMMLACSGAGSANKTAAGSVRLYNSDGDSAWGTTRTTRSVGFEDQVVLELHDDTDSRIRMPRVLLPNLHGGNGGWFDIKNVVIRTTEITGSIQVNIINSPKIVVDRMTGHISIAGKSGHYSGICRQFDPGAEAKF